MSIGRKRRLFWGRGTVVLLVFLMLFTGSASFISAPAVSASSWAGWDGIDTIAILPQSDEFLDTAAQELKTYLEQMSGWTWTIVQGDTADPAIRLDVDPDAPEFADRNDEAVQILSDATGIRIIGKTPIAARHGAYILLEKLGVRWFFRHPAWEVVPDSLIDLGSFSEVHEPAFIWRRIWYAVAVGAKETYDWRKRNRLGGAAVYEIKHSYYAIMPASEYSTYPDCYLPEGEEPTGYSKWQLKPDDPTVISRAIDYAYNYLSHDPGHWDPVPWGVVPISPNDGRNWGTYKEQEEGSPPPYQWLTDKVVTLTNTVAQAIADDFPGVYAGVYNYSLYSEVPSFDVDNVMIEVTTAYDVTDLSDVERIRGCKARGALVGVYDYYDPWVWYQEEIPWWSKKVWSRLKTFAAEGVDAYTAEAGDSWGSAGVSYYVSSKLLWNPDLTVDEILTDFYTKAFGPSVEPMKRYYTRWFSPRYVSNDTLALAFRDLNEAQQLATGHPEILERIRHIQYYLRYRWLSRQMDTMSLEECKDFYTFVTKLKNLYILHYMYAWDVPRRELRNRGMSDTEIDALYDDTPPTAAEANAWMNEALAAFEGINPMDADYIDPANLVLVPLGNTTLPQLDSCRGRQRTVVVEAQAGDVVEARIWSYGGTFRWYGPDGELLETIEVEGSAEWQTLMLSAPVTGRYTFAGFGGIDIIDYPAGFISGDLASGEFYIYVPEGTETLLIEVEPRSEISYLYDPTGALAVTIEGSGETAISGGVENPQMGVWKLSYDGEIDTTCGFQIYGVPDIAWHDAEYLLVPAAGSYNPPVANYQSVTTNEDTPISITLSGSDPDGDPLTYAISTSPSHGTLSGTPPSVTYTPNPDFCGSDSFAFTASDGSTISNPATVTITVDPTDDPPVASNQGVTTNEDTPISITLSGSDPDGDSLTYDIATSPSHGTLSGTPPNVTYTPNTSFSGSDSFTFTASDGTATSNIATVTITIASTPSPTGGGGGGGGGGGSGTSNSPPTPSPQVISTDEDTPVDTTLSASDPDGDSLTYEIITSPSHGTISGTPPDVIYTPDPDFSGSDNFTFTASDGTNISSPAIVTITVNPTNDWPVAEEQSVTINEEGTPVTITLTASDPDGDSLTYIAKGPSHGTLSGTPPDVTYIPDPDFSGSDSFTFTVSDGTATSSPATVTITIGPISEQLPLLPMLNSPPEANSQSRTTSKDASLSITLSASDPDGDSLTYDIVTGPSHGTLSGTPPDVTYTPDPDFSGSDSFTFTASDGTATSNTATVTITVEPEKLALGMPFGKGWNLDSFPVIFIVSLIILLLAISGAVYLRIYLRMRAT